MDQIDSSTAREARLRKLLESAQERMEELEGASSFNAARMRRLQQARRDYRDLYLQWSEALKKTQMPNPGGFL